MEEAGVITQNDDGSFDVSNAVDIKTCDKGEVDKEEVAEVVEKKEPTPLEKALAFKEEGNNFYRDKNWEQAAACYSDAINVLAGSHGYDPEIFEREMKELSLKSGGSGDNNSDEETAATAAENGDADAAAEEPSSDAVAKQNAEVKDAGDGIGIPQEHRHHLAVFHCNRAACLLQLVRYADVVDDCNAAVELNEKYTKAYVRRAQAFEALDRPDDALKDYEEVCKLEPTVIQHRLKRDRLQQMCTERMEKLKEETMGKLKDLGNSILNKFGMSLDNFNLKKDEDSGSYSISYNNGPAP